MDGILASVRGVCLAYGLGRVKKADVKASKESGKAKGMN